MKLGAISPSGARTCALWMFYRSLDASSRAVVPAVSGLGLLVGAVAVRSLAKLQARRSPGRTRLGLIAAFTTVCWYTASTVSCSKWHVFPASSTLGSHAATKREPEAWRCAPHQDGRVLALTGECPACGEDVYSFVQVPASTTPVPAALRCAAPLRAPLPPCAARMREVMRVRDAAAWRSLRRGMDPCVRGLS